MQWAFRLSGLKHINSPRNHISISNCGDVTIFDLHIIAPENSPNTDGIDISRSTQVIINNSIIATVEGICIDSCTFNGTLNGARVKIWPGGTGYARNISFEHIYLNNVKHPIIIDQHYCNDSHDCPELTNVVQVSNVYFANVHGTSANKEAIMLDCSLNVPCTNITMERIKITLSTDGSEVFATCKNVRGNFVSTIPNVSCLS
ncbi:hypothetical protein ACSBR2_037033 [Camellia fascicularis]